MTGLRKSKNGKVWALAVCPGYNPSAMDIFFTDPTETPLPPEEVRIRRLEASPYSDGRRVRVTFEVDPFQKRPSADLRIRNAEDETVASVTVIETMIAKMDLTMHIREGEPGGNYLLEAILFYEEHPDSEEEPSEPEQKVVDTANTTFQIDIADDR